MRLLISKLVVVSAFLTFAVLASGGCSPQENAQDKGQDAAEKQPGKGEAGGSDTPSLGAPGMGVQVAATQPHAAILSG